jgi:hypothetical protein
MRSGSASVESSGNSISVETAEGGRVLVLLAAREPHVDALDAVRELGDS